MHLEVQSSSNNFFLLELFLLKKNISRRQIGGNAENYYKYEEEIGKIKLKNMNEVIKLKGFSFVALVPN